ncbi:site-specific DNA-methyltransferase [Rhizobium leguminosarum]|uniref:site-specific DNA-methyltransferase n=1 Tax=Rhizobium leguminosarum TaxID=384 RepID=UPI0014419D5B|nr:site-specific DNA-methyltransferase [Rhizobium leguminosarum]NKK32371.1 site-specific DNA-methyltransferase [Rhizobium leguminosarum bv. viciae]
MARTPKSPRIIDALKHDGASRINIPTAEMESFFRRDEDTSPMPPKSYPRTRPLAPGTTRTAEEPSKPELIWNGATITITDEQMHELAETGRLTLSDAQLVWRGKDSQDWSDLIVNVPPLYIQEKIHPKAIIDDLKRRTAANREAQTDAPDLFADFNGVEPDQRAEFYQHDQHWSNRMILGDSLQVMASLAERESLRGKVQCIYFDPPYGIKFNSNWQVSTQSRDVTDKQRDISREPEQVKAFRDTWKDGIHSYLTYIRDRLTLMRDLLTESGSIFVQIGDENVHRVRAVMDEVFGAENFVAQIQLKKSGGATSEYLSGITDFVCWFAKRRPVLKYRSVYQADGSRRDDDYGLVEYDVDHWTTKTQAAAEGHQGKALQLITLTSQRQGRDTSESSAMGYSFTFRGERFLPSKGRGWTTTESGMTRLDKAGRIGPSGNNIRLKKYLDDAPGQAVTDFWDDLIAGAGRDKTYVVQTGVGVIERCILMATDPGDLVLDPTCGSGTTAFVAEQWGRRWITMDTSRVALALARTRLMAARYPWYLLADSREGRMKEAALTRRPQPDMQARNDIRQGFVYERVPHITLKSIANNTLIDDIWEKWQEVLEPRRVELNQLVGMDWQEWEIPREPDKSWSDNVRGVHKAWREARIARQTEIDASIAARAEVQYLYDKPYADNNRVRVAGPFTVESLSPHRVLPASEEELIDEIAAAEGRRSAADADLAGQDFAAIVIDYLRTEGVKQQDKGDRIAFDSLMPWPGGKFIGASGTFIEGQNGPERRAAILIGPEYGTVGRQDIVAAAREAVDARFDVLIACAFNFDAHSSELGSLGSLKILKARINPDMHMSEELKNTGRGNMFVVFGEPDVDIIDDGGPQIRVKVNGVDVFDPNTGDIRSNDTAGIAAWFVDTDYNEESFFVRHAYFLGDNDPYKSLRTALKADIDKDAWATLYSDTSRPFDRPATGKIAVKVINHFGDEVMKVFGV